MAKSGPGEAYREGISLVGLGDMFPDEAAAGQVREVLDILTWGVGTEVFASRPLAASYSRSSSSLAARI